MKETKKRYKANTFELILKKKKNQSERKPKRHEWGWGKGVRVYSIHFQVYASKLSILEMATEIHTQTHTHTNMIFQANQEKMM